MDFFDDYRKRSDNEKRNSTVLSHICKNLSNSADKEYNLVCNRIKYKDFVKNYKQINLKDEVEKFKENGILNEIIKEIEDLNIKVLFKSNVHGKLHNERVIFLARTIAHYEGLSKDNDSIRILMDAAKYHDIGRKDDGLDKNHGIISAKKIDEVVKYENNEDLKTLKYIIEGHAAHDADSEKIMEKYQISDKERAATLLKILKDADNLDRVRLNLIVLIPRLMLIALDPNYLRTNTGKSCVKLAYELNNYYKRELKK